MVCRETCEQTGPSSSGTCEQTGPSSSDARRGAGGRLRATRPRGAPGAAASRGGCSSGGATSGPDNFRCGGCSSGGDTSGPDNFRCGAAASCDVWCPRRDGRAVKNPPVLRGAIVNLVCNSQLGLQCIPRVLFRDSRAGRSHRRTRPRVRRAAAPTTVSGRFAYKAKHPDELSFAAGDAITLLSPADDAGCAPAPVRLCAGPARAPPPPPSPLPPVLTGHVSFLLPY